MIQSWPYCWARLPERKCQRLGTEITPEECQVCFFRSQKPPEEPEPEAVQEKSPPPDRTHNGRMGHMVTPLSGIVGRRYKEQRPSKEEFKRIKEEREAKPCSTCRYHGTFHSGGRSHQQYSHCNYLLQTGRLRPCDPMECKAAGIYKEAKNGSRPPRRPFRTMPTLEPDVEDELVAKIKRKQEKDREDEKIQ